MSIQRYGLRRRLLRFTVCGILLPISALFFVYGQYIGHSMKQTALQQAAAAHPWHSDANLLQCYARLLYLL